MGRRTKNRGIRRYTKQIDKWFSRYVRLKRAGRNGYVKCYTCGIKKNRKEIQVGHFFSRRYLATRRDEENVRPQCYRCNVLLNGNYIVYTRKMIKEVGEKKIEEIERKTKELKKRRVEELRELLEFYKEEVKRLEKEKGL